MAQRVNVILVDDLDGSDADETITFGLDGSRYEIDLADKNARALRDAIGPFIEKARRVGGRRKARAKQNGHASRVSSADIRQWGRDNGWEVPERGRVAAELREAYTAAH